MLKVDYVQRYYALRWRHVSNVEGRKKKKAGTRERSALPLGTRSCTWSKSMSKSKRQTSLHRAFVNVSVSDFTVGRVYVFQGKTRGRRGKFELGMF